ncbi:MAG: NAD-dependent epimerase/dehydratase family protein [Planctomycetes bacterium]|nr:NAD-dependent epimerase/dehydratase family protein [Planctomycetota bacterium]
MNVLVTGGAGLIGSYLSEFILRQPGDHSVVCVDDLSTGSLDNVRAVATHPRYRFVRDSIRNVNTMTTLIDRCDLVFHLAAAVGVQLIVDQPVRTIETNIHGSEIVLELANKFGRKVLLASSSEVYGKSDNVPFREDNDIVLGSTRFSRWCYACSKMVDEFLALAYFDQFGLPVVVCRFFNTVGPRQIGTYGMVIPRFVQAALRNEPISIYGSGKQVRSFCHVADIVGALWKLAACPEAVGQVINLGSTESVSIEALADLVIELTASRGGKVYLTYEQAYGKPFDDLPRRVPDVSRARKLIAFAPTISLRQTLEQVIEYERNRMA